MLKTGHSIGVARPSSLRPTRIPMPVQPAEQRVKNFSEVNLGYTAEMAVQEASRCLQCRRRPCVKGCPVGIDIPSFVGAVAAGDFGGALAIIHQENSLPAVCGRVCPQEIQCESLCVLARQGEPVAIGNLERFVADWGREYEASQAKQASRQTVKLSSNNKGRVAVVGSGPASLAAAAELSRLGYGCVVFEALHTPGGVLAYGIPEFRLPKDIVAHEFSNLTAMGVEIRTNVLVGRTQTIEDLFAQGFQAVFLGTGAGLPQFLGIPGEDLNGVYTANEFLTRVNLMKAYLPEADTPVYLGKHVIVVGGGNTAMDAARTARRLGSQVTLVYRRAREELPARLAEVIHAEEEGVIFRFSTCPTAIRGDDEGWVEAVQCAKVIPGDVDDSGRHRLEPLAGSEYWLEADSVIMAIGQGPNPIVAQTTPGLEIGSHLTIRVDPETFATSREGIFAAGDVTSGGATVIEAMGGGKRAARAIANYLQRKTSNATLVTKS